MLDDSLLIGETITFTDGYGERSGLVMGLVTMKFQSTDIFPTTGYSVLSKENGTLENIPYWKVRGVVEPDISFLELLAKEGDLISVEFPKYYNHPHPKGWEVNGEHNTDLPFA